VLISLDPGHGGGDIGCNASGICEKDIVLQVAQALRATAAALPWLDITAKLARDSDRNLGLSEAGALSRAHRSELVLCLHVDAAIDASATGLRAYVMPDSRNAVLELAIAKALQASAPAPLRQVAAPFEATPARAVTEKFVQHVRHVIGPHAEHTPTVLLELGFITNPMDRTYLASRVGQGELALSLLSGLSRARAIRGGS